MSATPFRCPCGSELGEGARRGLCGACVAKRNKENEKARLRIDLRECVATEHTVVAATRRALLAARAAGCTYKELGKDMGLHLQTVKHRVDAALVLLELDSLPAKPSPGTTGKEDST